MGKKGRTVSPAAQACSSARVAECTSQTPWRASLHSVAPAAGDLQLARSPKGGVPHGVEPALLAVGAFVGVGAKEVALGLQQQGRAKQGRAGRGGLV